MLKSPVEVVPAAQADSCTAAGPRRSSFSVGDLLVNNHEQPWLDMAGSHFNIFNPFGCHHWDFQT